MIKKITTMVHTNKKAILKRALIVAGSTLGVVLAEGFFNRHDDEVLVVEEEIEIDVTTEDGSES